MRLFIKLHPSSNQDGIEDETRSTCVALWTKYGLQESFVFVWSIIVEYPQQDIHDICFFFAFLLMVVSSLTLYFSYFIFRSLQRSHSNSLPRNMSLGPQAGQPGHSEVPAESFQDVSLQSLQWLESRGLYGGKANDDNLDTGKVQLPVSSGGSGRGHRSRGHLSEEVYTMQMNSNTDRWAY